MSHSHYCKVSEKIMNAVVNDECLQMKIKDAVIAAVEKELYHADVISKCDDPEIGCVSVLFTLVCTC
jgi:hypothetical protein